VRVCTRVVRVQVEGELGPERAQGAWLLGPAAGVPAVGHDLGQPASWEDPPVLAGVFGYGTPLVPPRRHSVMKKPTPYL